MRLICAFLLISAIASSQSKPAAAAIPTDLSDLGFVYTLSPDWILATTLIRKQAAEQNNPAPVLLAAVYVPENKNLTESSPFFSVLAFRQAKPDCKQFMDAMASQLQKQEKTRITRARSRSWLAPTSFCGRILSRRSF